MIAPFITLMNHQRKHLLFSYIYIFRWIDYKKLGKINKWLLMYISTLDLKKIAKSSCMYIGIWVWHLHDSFVQSLLLCIRTYNSQKFFTAIFVLTHIHPILIESNRLRQTTCIKPNRQLSLSKLSKYCYILTTDFSLTMESLRVNLISKIWFKVIRNTI